MVAHTLAIAETLSIRVSATPTGQVELAALRRSAASTDPADWIPVFGVRLVPDDARELRSALTLAVHAAESDE